MARQSIEIDPIWGGPAGTPNPAETSGYTRTAPANNNRFNATAIDRNLRPGDAAVFFVGIVFGGPQATRSQDRRTPGAGDIVLHFARTAGGGLNEERVDLSDRWERTGRIEVDFEIGVATYLFRNSDRDDAAPYLIDAANADDVTAAFNSVGELLQGEFPAIRPARITFDDGAIPTVRVEGLNIFFGGFPSRMQYRWIDAGGVEYGDWVYSNAIDGTAMLVAGRRYQFRDGDDGTPFPEIGHVAASSGSDLIESAPLITGFIETSPGIHVVAGTTVTFRAPPVSGYATGDVTRQWQYFRDGRWENLLNETGETYQSRYTGDATERVRVLTGREGFESISEETTVTWYVQLPVARAGTIRLSNWVRGLRLAAGESRQFVPSIERDTGIYDTVELSTSVSGRLAGRFNPRAFQYVAPNPRPEEVIGVTMDVGAEFDGTGTRARAGTSAFAGVNFQFEVYGVSHDTVRRYALAPEMPPVEYLQPVVQFDGGVFSAHDHFTGEPSATAFQHRVDAAGGTNYGDWVAGNIADPVNVPFGQRVQFRDGYGGAPFPVDGYVVRDGLSGEFNGPGRQPQEPLAPWTHVTRPDPTETEAVWQLDWTREYRGDGTRAVYHGGVAVIRQVSSPVPTDTIIAMYALGANPPDFPAADVELPSAPWFTHEPQPTASEHVWELGWDRIYVLGEFQSARGEIFHHALRTGGNSQVVPLGGSDYTASPTRRFWQERDNDRMQIIPGLVPSGNVFFRLLNLRIDDDRMQLDFATGQRGDDRADLTPRWETLGKIVLLGGGQFFVAEFSDPEVTNSGMAGQDPYAYTFTGDALTRFRAFRNALAATGQDADMLLDDNRQPTPRGTALLGVGTRDTIPLAPLFIGDGDDTPIEATYVLLGDGTEQGIRII